MPGVLIISQRCSCTSHGIQWLKRSLLPNYCPTSSLMHSSCTCLLHRLLHCWCCAPVVRPPRPRRSFQLLPGGRLCRFQLPTQLCLSCPCLFPGSTHEGRLQLQAERKDTNGRQVKPWTSACVEQGDSLTASSPSLEVAMPSVPRLTRARCPAREPLRASAASAFSSASSRRSAAYCSWSSTAVGIEEGRNAWQGLATAAAAAAAAAPSPEASVAGRPSFLAGGACAVLRCRSPQLAPAHRSAWHESFQRSPRQSTGTALLFSFESATMSAAN